MGLKALGKEKSELYSGAYGNCGFVLGRELTCLALALGFSLFVDVVLRLFRRLPRDAKLLSKTKYATKTNTKT